MYGHEIVTERNIEPPPTQQIITPEFLTNSEKEFKLMGERFHKTAQYVDLCVARPGSKKTRLKISFSDFPEIIRMVHVAFGDKCFVKKHYADSSIATERGICLHEVFCSWNTSQNKPIEKIEFEEDALKLISALMKQQSETYAERQTYCEVGGIYNISDLSPLISNVQIPLRLDLIEKLKLKNGKQKIVIKDLKTGNPNLTDEEKLQALFMVLLAEKTVKEILKEEWEYSRDVWNIFFHTFKHYQHPKAFNLYYSFFDGRQCGDIKDVLISLRDEKYREMVLERLVFYVEVALAFKKQVKEILAKTRQELEPCYLVQNELPIIYPNSLGGVILDLSNVPPARKKQEKEYHGPFYKFGISEAEEECPHCKSHMQQRCYDVRDFGGDKISFWVQLICNGNGKHKPHNETYYMQSVPREMLKH